MSKVTTAQGHEVDFAAAVNLMDDEIREYLYDKGNGWNDGQSDQQFFDAYCAAHAEKFGETFTVA